MGQPYPPQGQMPPAYQQNPYGYAPQGTPTVYGGQPAAPQPDPWAASMPAQAGFDPFDNAIPDGRGQRVAMAGPNGQPHMVNGEPYMVTLPTLRTLGPGRLIFIVPKKIERHIKNNFESEKEFVDRLTADIIVCDGAPGMFGGDPTKSTPDLLGPFPVPCVIEDIWIQNDGIIERVPETLIGSGFKIGRIVKAKTKSNRTAWNFGAPDEDEGKARAIVQSLRPLWAAYQAGQLPILSRKSLAEQYGVKPGATVQQTAPVASYSPNPPVSPNPYAQQAQQQSMTPPAGMQMQPTINQPPAWPPMQPGQNMAPMQQQIGLTPQGQQVAQAAQMPVSAPASPAGDWTLSVALPPALEAFRPMWGTMAPEHREQMLAQAGVVRPGAGAYEQQAPAQAQAATGPYAAPPPY